MKQRKMCFLMMLALGGLLAGVATGWAQEFQPALGQAQELISGPAVPQATIPPDAPELKTYPLPKEQTRELLTEIPGKPLKQVSPTPRTLAWWKLPVYATLGLPRDLVDAVAGGLNYVPILNIFLVYLPYEVLPSQLIARDPRDWHRWPGRRNSRGHGMVDGTWGFFPSAHSWHFTYPSQRLARQYELYNQAVQKELTERNHEIEAANQKIATRLQDARTKALEAIQAGNGREAALRMIGYHQSYPLDEGAFALYVTALTLYRSEGPAWAGPVLWDTLYSAQPRLLAGAEKLLAQTAKTFPKRLELGETLVLTHLLLNNKNAAMAQARVLHVQKPDDARYDRLVFETALSTGNGQMAKDALASMKAEQVDKPTWTLMQTRLQMLTGQAEQARQTLTELQKQQPQDAYLNYYLGCAIFLAGKAKANPSEDIRQATSLVERANLSAPGPALRTRAATMAAYLRGVTAGIAENPELFPQPAPAAPAK